MELDIKHIEGLMWTPVRTKPRCEKKLAEYCTKNSVPAYLPLVKSLKRYQRRNTVFYLPMFSGYVFCALDNKYFNEIVRSNCVVHKLKIDEHTEKQLIEDLKAVREFELRTEEVEIVIRPEISTGKKVLVTKGPLKGFSGIVEKRKNKTMIGVNVEILGQYVSSEIDVECLEPEEF